MGTHIWARRRLAVSLASAAVLVATVVGCGTQSAEPEPKDWDENSQSEQQANGESSDGRENSDEAAGKDDEPVKQRDGENDPLAPDAAVKAEAEAFIADYLDAQNAATKNGDFSQVDAMVEQCDVCDASRSTIEDVYDRGGKVKGGLFEDPKIHADWQKDGEVGLTVVTTLGSYEVLDASGAVVDSGEPEKDTFRYTISRNQGAWKIVSGRS